MCIRDSSKSNKLQDQVFWYKADARPSFKIGSLNFWKFSEENYDSNGSNEDDFMSARRKREGKFNVVKGS